MVQDSIFYEKILELRVQYINIQGSFKSCKDHEDVQKLKCLLSV